MVMFGCSFANTFPLSALTTTMQIIVCEISDPYCIYQEPSFNSSLSEVVLMSAFDVNDPLYMTLSSSLKINSFIQKPFTLKEVIFIIMKQLVQRGK
jgi:hypothetical protein